MTHLSLSNVTTLDIAGHLTMMEAQRQDQPTSQPELAAGLISNFHPVFAERAQGPLGIINGVFDGGFSSTSGTAMTTQASLQSTVPTSTTAMHPSRTSRTQSTFFKPGLG